MNNPLNTEHLPTHLAGLPDWRWDAAHGAITREFVLADFLSAFEFMQQIALEAEKHDHHPEWRNVYNKVQITWTTHDADGLTDKDLRMAQICDQLFSVAPGAQVQPQAKG